MMKRIFIIITSSVVCLQSMDAAERRRPKKNHATPTGMMSLSELDHRELMLKASIDWQTGVHYNEPVITSTDISRMLCGEQDGPTAHPSWSITRQTLQKAKGYVNDSIPAVAGFFLTLTTGSQLPCFLGLFTTELCAIGTMMVHDTDDIAAEEKAERDDVATVVDAVEHLRWAQQHPRLAAVAKRKEKTE